MHPYMSFDNVAKIELDKPRFHPGQEGSHGPFTARTMRIYGEDGSVYAVTIFTNGDVAAKVEVIE